MSVWEIVAGVLLILSCISVIGAVLSQEAKGQGLSSVVTGTQLTSGDSRSRVKEVRQVRFTQVVAVLLFVLTILVNVLSMLAG